MFVYLITLVLLGLGWNFLYVGGSSVIANSTTAEEKGRVQGVADFIIFSFVALAAMFSGLIHSEFGWDFMIVIVFVPIILILFTIIVGKPDLREKII